MPPSFLVAKFLRPIANSQFWNALFPGPNQEPEAVFGLDNQSGPRYIASLSGTIIDHTTHVAYLVTQQSKEEKNAIEVEGRETEPMTAAVFDVMYEHSSESTAKTPILKSVPKIIKIAGWNTYLSKLHRLCTVCI